MRSTPFSPAGEAFRPMVAALLLALAAASITGCGQRGPLYLPDTEPGADSPAAAADAGATAESPDSGGSDESRGGEDSG